MDCTEILKAVAKAADIKKIGVLSEADFMSILPSGGKVRQKYRDGSQMVEMTAQIQCRGSDQKGLIQSLEEAAEACISAYYPTTESYRIMNVTRGSFPMPVMADEKGNFIYSCGIIITFFAAKPRDNYFMQEVIK